MIPHLGKYFLEYFTKKLSGLTPFLNLKQKNYSSYKKVSTPLIETKNIYLKKDKFSERKLKEYSLIYLIINNLNFFSKKIESISEIPFSDKLINKFFIVLLSRSRSIYLVSSFCEYNSRKGNCKRY